MRRTASVLLVLATLACATKPAQVPAGPTVPVVLHKVDPVYPPALRAAHVQGAVTISALITKTGEVTNVEVVHSDDPRLDEFALDALRKWKFRPGTLGGQPVDVMYVGVVRFRTP